MTATVFLLFLRLPILAVILNLWMNIGPNKSFETFPGQVIASNYMIMEKSFGSLEMGERGLCLLAGLELALTLTS